MSDSEPRNANMPEGSASARRWKIPLPRYPVAWVTAFLFVLLGVATLDWFLGIVFVFVILPAVFFVQSVINWVFGGFPASPIWLRRGVMLIPAFGVAFALFPSTNGFSGRQRASITLALAHRTPAGLRDMLVFEGGWTDTFILAYFRCDPESLREILEHEPFRRLDSSLGFSFSKMPFKDKPISRVRDSVMSIRTRASALLM